MRYPEYFLNKNGNVVAKKSEDKSTDGTPRYNINHKCPENTYTLQDCLKDWTPIYKYYIGDKVKWVETFTKKEFDCVVRGIKSKDNLIKIVPDIEAENPLIYNHYFVEPNELKLNY